jgi:hypothetical protein
VILDPYDFIDIFEAANEADAAKVSLISRSTSATAVEMDYNSLFAFSRLFGRVKIDLKMTPLLRNADILIFQYCIE